MNNYTRDPLAECENTLVFTNANLDEIYDFIISQGMIDKIANVYNHGLTGVVVTFISNSDREQCLSAFPVAR